MTKDQLREQITLAEVAGAHSVAVGRETLRGLLDECGRLESLLYDKSIKTKIEEMYRDSYQQGQSPARFAHELRHFLLFELNDD